MLGIASLFTFVMCEEEIRRCHYSGAAKGTLVGRIRALGIGGKKSREQSMRQKNEKIVRFRTKNSRQSG